MKTAQIMGFSICGERDGVAVEGQYSSLDEACAAAHDEGVEVIINTTEGKIYLNCYGDPGETLEDWEKEIFERAKSYGL